MDEAVTCSHAKEIKPKLIVRLKTEAWGPKQVAQEIDLEQGINDLLAEHQPDDLLANNDELLADTIPDEISDQISDSTVPLGDEPALSTDGDTLSEGSTTSRAVSPANRGAAMPTSGLPPAPAGGSASVSFGIKSSSLGLKLDMEVIEGPRSAASRETGPIPLPPEVGSAEMMELTELSGEVEITAEGAVPITPVQPMAIEAKPGGGGDWMAMVAEKAVPIAAAGEEAEAAPPPTPFCAALVDAFC